MIKRMERIDELLTQEISRLIQEDAEELGIIAVVAVRTTRDLAQADVLIRAFDQDNVETVHKLSKRAFAYQAALNDRLSLRRVPKLLFIAEEEPERGDRIEEIFRELDKEQQ